MVKTLLPGSSCLTEDAADALAVAICHAHYARTRKVWNAA
jgi:crossover junction endodeoxyribonuclease RuvC